MITAATAKAAVRLWAYGYHAVEEWALDFESRVDLLLIPVGASASIMQVNRVGADGLTTSDKQRWIRDTQGSIVEDPDHRADYMSFWERCGLVGVEVKVTRADFLRGINAGQFGRYAKALAGLYVAFPHGVARLKEIPANVGALKLVVKPNGILTAVCLRHPRFNQQRPDSKTAWRLLFRLREEFVRQTRNHAAETHRWHDAVKKRYGQKVARAVASVLIRGGVE